MKKLLLFTLLVSAQNTVFTMEGDRPTTPPVRYETREERYNRLEEEKFHKRRAEKGFPEKKIAWNLMDTDSDGE